VFPPAGSDRAFEDQDGSGNRERGKEGKSGERRTSTYTRRVEAGERVVEHVADGRSGDVVLGAETQRRAAGVVVAAAAAAAGSARETGDVGGRWQSI